MMTYELWTLKSPWRIQPRELLRRLRAEPGTLLEDAGVPLEAEVEQLPELVDPELAGSELDTVVQERIATLADEIRNTVARRGIWIAPSALHAVTAAQRD